MRPWLRIETPDASTRTVTSSRPIGVPSGRPCTRWAGARPPPVPGRSWTEPAESPRYNSVGTSSRSYQSHPGRVGQVSQVGQVGGPGRRTRQNRERCRAGLPGNSRKRSNRGAGPIGSAGGGRHRPRVVSARAADQRHSGSHRRLGLLRGLAHAAGADAHRHARARVGRHDPARRAGRSGRGDDRPGSSSSSSPRTCSWRRWRGRSPRCGCMGRARRGRSSSRSTAPPGSASGRTTVTATWPFGESRWSSSRASISLACPVTAHSSAPPAHDALVAALAATGAVPAGPEALEPQPHRGGVSAVRRRHDRRHDSARSGHRAAGDLPRRRAATSGRKSSSASCIAGTAA